MDRREQHRRDRRGQVVALHDVARVLVVGAIRDHELHLVVRRSSSRFGQCIVSRLAAARALHVDDADAPRPAPRPTLRWPPVSSSTVVAGLEQPLHQRDRRPSAAAARRRSARPAGSRSAATSASTSSTTSSAAREGVRRVAPRAAQVAGGQPHEHAGPARHRSIRPGWTGRSRRWSTLRTPAPRRRAELACRSSPWPTPRIRIGTSGWSYPSGPGAWTGIVYPPRRGGRRARSTSSPAYAERFDTVEVNSTLLPHPDRRDHARVGGADARRLRVLGEAVPEAHPPADVPRSDHHAAEGRAEGRASRRESALPHHDALAAAGVSSADVDDFRRAIDPLASAGKLGAILVQFPASFKARPGAASTTSPG